MNQSTPQEQAENMMKGIKNTYQVVAKRHVHPWYGWALMAAAIGFTMGVAYVANQNAQFDASRAARPCLSAPSMLPTNPSQQPCAQFADSETAKAPESQMTIATPQNPLNEPDRHLFDNKAFTISYPASFSQVETNPSITIDFDNGLIPKSAAGFEFEYAMADQQGRAVAPFKKITANMYKSVYTPGQATYVLDGFDQLPPTTYLIRSFIPQLVNVYADVVVIKNGQAVAKTGECACKKIVVEDLGANDTEHGLKVVATGEHLDYCTEYQKAKVTLSRTSGSGEDEHTDSLYLTDKGINGFMTQEEVDSNNNANSKIPGAPNIKTYPYEGNAYTDDDFKSESQAGSLGTKKVHGDTKVQWWDYPGFLLKSPSTLEKPWTIKFDAELVHAVGSCKCVTGVHITVKDGKVIENKLDPICQ